MKPEYDMCMERVPMLHLVSAYIVLYTTKDAVVFAEDEAV